MKPPAPPGNAYTVAGITAPTPVVRAANLRFPEGPVATGDGSLYVVEMYAGAITRVSPRGEASVVARPGGGPNGLAVGGDGALYCCNNGGYLWHEGPGDRPKEGEDRYTIGRVERIDPSTGEVTRLFERSDERPLSGPNDLVFDAEGGFYFTDMGKSSPQHRVHGAVYYVAPGASSIREIAFPMVTPNGIGLSPDGSVLYVAETNTARLWAFHIESPGIVRKVAGAPHGGRLVIGLGGYQRFDSLAVEANGNICVATMVSGCISVITAEGELLEQVPMGDPHTTNLCFGGPDLTTAYVTRSGAGEIVEIPWPRQGLVLPFQSHAPAPSPTQMDAM